MEKDTSEISSSKDQGSRLPPAILWGYLPLQLQGSSSVSLHFCDHMWGRSGVGKWQRMLSTAWQGKPFSGRPGVLQGCECMSHAPAPWSCAQSPELVTVFYRGMLESYIWQDMKWCCKTSPNLHVILHFKHPSIRKIFSSNSCKNKS